MKKFGILSAILLGVWFFLGAQELPQNSYAANSLNIDAKFDVESKKIYIEQTIVYTNTSKDTLSTVYLNDWMESFSTKSTPLAKRFAEEFNTDIHFAKNEERGFTVITSMSQNNKEVANSRLKEQLDVVSVNLNEPVAPGESYHLKINYIVQVPSSKFTRYGITSSGEFNLRYWYITPAVYDGEWQYQSHKNLDDLYIPLSEISISITCPTYFYVNSELTKKKRLLTMKSRKFI